MGPSVVKAKGLNCPNCGGAVELRGFAHTLSAVCPGCLSVLDVSGPLLTILQTAQVKQRVQPLIPLGTRGKLGDTVYELIGFQVREVRSDDGSFSWSEYLLFNPYKGFRYLSEYNGHWNLIRPLSALPEPTMVRHRGGVSYQGRKYAIFDQSTAVTSYVLGEFPWQVRVGETVRVSDFISPPYMLSSEETGSEITWSLGEYYTGLQIWQAFKLPGSPRPAVGVFANQPEVKTGSALSAWKTWFGLMLAWSAILLFFTVKADRHEVFRHSYTFAPGPGSEPSFVTSEFELGGGTQNAEIAINTDLRSDWAYFNFALINQTTGQARDFGREVSYYGDEGSPKNRVVVPQVAPGKYYLRVEPEKPAGSTPVNYELVIRRNVPTYGWLWVVAGLLLIPPIVVTFRGSSMERERWAQSDFAASGSEGGE